MELGPNQLKWIAALEDGEYIQTICCLKNIEGYCCLGVAAEICPGVEFSDRADHDDQYRLPAPDGNNGRSYNSNDLNGTGVMEWLGLKDPNGQPLEHERGKNGIDLDSLVNYNDDRDYTFRDIADHLREYPEAYFKESK